MRRNVVVLFAVALICQVKTNAQQKGDTTLKSTTIEVIQSYKPEVRQIPKPEFTPDIPQRDTSKPRLKYDVPQQALYYTYSSLPLRPLALGKDTTRLPFPSYIKLGGGNQSTIYGEAGIASLKGDNYETAIRLHHLSQDGQIKNQRTSLSGLEAVGTLHTNTNAWQLAVDGLRNQYHYYGYNHDLYDYPRDTIKQTYTGFAASLDVRNESPNKWGIDYHPAVSASIYGDDHEAKERTISFNLPVSKDIDTVMRIGLGINGSFTHFVNPVTELDNNIFQLTPRADFHSGGFAAKIGLYPTFGMNGNSYILPDIGINYQFPHTRFMIAAGWEARLKQNTFKELSTYNPYLFTVYETRQTRTDEVYGRVSTGIGNHVTASAKIGWLQYNNLPLFLNDIADQKSFYIVYDESVSAISLEFSLRYQVANSLSVGATGTFMNFYEKSYSRVWHEPGVRVKGDLIYRPLPALTVTAYAVIMDQLYAINEQHEEMKLDGIFDIGGGAEYSFIPRLSAFLNVNNLLNDRYQRWYSYNSYGINVFGGLRLKF